MGMTTAALFGSVPDDVYMGAGADKLPEVKCSCQGDCGCKDEPLSALELEEEEFLLRRIEELIKSNRKWDKRFLNLAKHVAQWSKDPSRKVGAVIVDYDRSIISLGYNGFARGVIDSDERLNDRSTKLDLVVHAEVNAILTAKKDLTRATLYCTLMPCSRCAAILINAGIKTVVSIKDTSGSATLNAVHNFGLSEQQFKEAGIQIRIYENDELGE